MVRASTEIRDLAQRWVHANRAFELAIKRHRSAELHHLDRRSYVILTAPHAGRQFRDNWIKQSDFGSGALAQVLSEFLDCGYLTVSGDQLDDPNWDIGKGAFKHRLSALLGRERHFVLDLHTMVRDHRPDLCVGLGNNPSPHARAVAHSMVDRARAMGLRATVNDPFTARHPGTVTSFVQSTHRHALQIEINTAFMSPQTSPENAEKILELLASVVREIEAIETCRRGAAAPNPALNRDHQLT